ncbi:MAG: Coenzyme F420 hydrogenase/dehydrogenase, beta subunit C-terminal domain [Chloroflexi bacterium]|nr:Coenzyme F420 hydrogenase/dehydrogenase, beta subunit C-terminal domain [Chloroflexota bacterium]
MSKTFLDLKRDVIDADLCTRCGSCVGVCREGVLRFDDPLGVCLPASTDVCASCDGICYDGCSGREVSWPDLNAQVFGRQPESYLLGNYDGAYVGFATDVALRAGAASGGVVSAMSAYLLDAKLVDGVVTLVDDETVPYRAVPRIVTDRAGVVAAAQSRYSISPVNTILAELAQREGVFAYVGLPCQVHSLRKLQQLGHPAALKIKYVLGTYCGNVLHFDAVRSYLARSGIHDLSQVTSLKYRAGDWPGKLEIRLRDGRVFALEKFYANYLIPFYIMQRCLLCTDLANEFADVAVGDGWAPVYEERGKGWSIVLGRTPLGAELLKAMRAAGRLELHPIVEEAAVNMHSHGLDLKKRGAFLRIERRRRWGRPVPEYGYTLGPVPWRRRALETALGIVFQACSLPVSRWLINRVPLPLIGRAFKLARRVWIRSTKSSKRQGLLKTELYRTG